MNMVSFNNPLNFGLMLKSDSGNLDTPSFLSLPHFRKMRDLLQSAAPLEILETVFGHPHANSNYFSMTIPQTARPDSSRYINQLLIVQT